MEDKSNILIVDDLPEKLLVFKTILEELDQNLIMVRSGSDALKEIPAARVRRDPASTSTCPISTGWRPRA
jgi:CheY-like chemotaxis protein